MTSYLRLLRIGHTIEVKSRKFEGGLWLKNLNSEVVNSDSENLKIAVGKKSLIFVVDNFGKIYFVAEKNFSFDFATEVVETSRNFLEILDCYFDTDREKVPRLLPREFVF